MLPSEVLAKATTYDLMVTDVLATYESYEMHKASGTVMPQEGQFEEDELLDILRKANEQHK
jgi:hypothetical protein